MVSLLHFSIRNCLSRWSGSTIDRVQVSDQEKTAQDTMLNIINLLLFLRNKNPLLLQFTNIQLCHFQKSDPKLCFKLFQLIFSDPKWSIFIMNTLFIRPSGQQDKPGRGALGSQRWDLQIRESWSKIKLKKCVQSFYNDWGDCKRTQVAGIPTLFKRL